MKLELNRIYHRDCMDGMKEIADRSFEMILTDIPYDIVNRESQGIRTFDKGAADTLTFNLRQFVAECIRIAKGSIYIFCADEQAGDIRTQMIEAGMSTRHIIWEKTNPSPVNGQHLWLSSMEHAIFGRWGGAIFNESCVSPVFRYPNGSSKIHPTQKPIALFRRLISASSNPGDSVLDPCIGSGTTALACIKLERNFLGFELDETYYKLAKKRIDDVKAQRTLFDEEGL
jgi:site-specific DNA-methyltransferase (adenine-specific)